MSSLPTLCMHVHGTVGEDACRLGNMDDVEWYAEYPSMYEALREWARTGGDREAGAWVFTWRVHMECGGLEREWDRTHFGRVTRFATGIATRNITGVWETQAPEDRGESMSYARVGLWVASRLRLRGSGDGSEDRSEAEPQGASLVLWAAETELSGWVRSSDACTDFNARMGTSYAPPQFGRLVTEAGWTVKRTSKGSHVWVG